MPGIKSVVGMEGMGGARELAEMLRQLGRGRDTVLAHITPEEAQMLMDMGGSGTTNPDTGLPEFLDIYGGEEQSAYDVESQPGGYYGQTERATFNPYTQETRLYNEDISTAQPGPGGSYKDFYDRALRQTISSMPPEQVDIGFGPGRFFQPEFAPAELRGAPREDMARMLPEPGMLAQGAQAVEGAAATARELAGKYPTVAKLLSTGATTLPTLINAIRARREGERAAEQFRQLGAPLRQQGEALRQQALAGQLTPQQAQQQEAERARVRQAAANRGVTTGTQQAMIENQLARQRAALGETNLNNAIKILNLANAYDEEAIRLKLASDQRINAIVGNIFANLGATTAEVVGVPTGGGQQQRQPVTRRPEIPRGTA